MRAMAPHFQFATEAQRAQRKDMITTIATVTVFVEDQDRAKAFYTEKLGFELINDSEMFPGAEIRWLTVAPEGCPTELTLFPMGGQWEHYREAMGKPQCFTLNCDDLMETYRELTAKGVQFLGEPQVQEWGSFAMLLDSEGNQIVLGQRA